MTSPFPRLPHLVAAVYRHDQDAGRTALATVAAHPRQAGRAAAAIALIIDDEMVHCRTGADIAGFRTQSFRPPEGGLSDADAAAYRDTIAVSEFVSNAIEATSAATSVNRLTDADQNVRSRMSSPAAFAAGIRQWASIIETELAAARRRLAETERLPNPFSRDGIALDITGSGEQRPFVGRDALLRRIESAVDPSNPTRATLLLLGPRRIGKSSVVQALPVRLGQRVIPVFLNMQAETLVGADTTASFLYSVIDKCRTAARNDRHVELPVADTGPEPFVSFGRWLDRVEQHLDATDHLLLLSIDEFEKLDKAFNEGRLDERFLDSLRSIIQYRRRIHVLLSGSKPFEQLHPRWSSALLTTEVLPISVLDEPAARQLITSPTTDYPPDWCTPEAIERILELTGRQPNLLQVLCHRLAADVNDRFIADRTTDPLPVTPADIDRLAPELYVSSSGFFDTLWRQELDNHAQELLTALSRGSVVRPPHPGFAAASRNEVVGITNGHITVRIPLVIGYVRDRLQRETGD